MKKEMDTKYSPKDVEDRLYKFWLDKGYFHAEVDKSKTPYTIMIPPPNVTGQLHMGHALNATLQDILIRSKKMQGFNTLWQPGTDHAAIATEAKVVAQIQKDEGLSKADLGRDEFMKRAWAWNDRVGGIISQQFRKLGVSCDWERERFTLDEGLSEAVTEMFVRLHEKGLVYRGERLVNWCTNCKTSISDAEVEHEDKQGGFWHFKYPIKDSDEFVTFATTRPETMLGDVAIAVNPDDERYKHLIGKSAIMPLFNRELPIVADDYVKADFGTGMVKITPAHDFNDFEIGVRHNLPSINIMNDDGTINENGGSYEGMDRYDARKKIVAEFTELGLFVKKEEINNSVGGHDRCGSIVEPLMKLQWFIKMEDLAKPALEAYKNGDLNIVPPRFGKVYTHWLENIKDWCVSRQLWWGHRIPAYYCGDCGEITVSRTAPIACKCGCTNLIQDEDSLDTWFSSALWPFSTLGWPNKTPELEYFYPTNVLSTGHDILFFWVVRMVFTGLEFMGELPFKDVLFHGLIRDEQGRKFSKSLDNGVDPLDVIEQYGADALRFTLATGNSPGNDLRFYIEKVEQSRNFLNKVWNASRFIMMNLDNAVLDVDLNVSDLTPADKWIISKANRLTAEVAKHLDNYDMGMAADEVQTFMWDEFCDWYIEFSKPRLYNADDPTRPAALWTLRHVLSVGLRLLHPFSPFLTEEIYQSFGFGESILLSQFPTYDEAHNFASDEADIEQIKEAVRALRNLRQQKDVPPSRKAKTFVVSANEDVRRIFEGGKAYIMALAGASEVIVSATKDVTPENVVSVVVPSAEIFMPLSDLVDMAKEKARLEKELKKLQGEVDRVNAKLNNQGFLAKAPEAMVEEERAKGEKYQEMLEVIQKQLEQTMNG